MQLVLHRQQLDDHFTKNLALALTKLTVLIQLYLNLSINMIADIGAALLLTYLYLT
jgi:hypothetical protein